jgi:hypothetical protein
MSSDEHFEDCLVSLGEESVDKLSIGLVSKAFRIHPPRQPTDSGLGIAPCHTGSS